jgi:hypothetical protein
MGGARPIRIVRTVGSGGRGPIRLSIRLAYLQVMILFPQLPLSRTDTYESTMRSWF